MIDLAKTFNVLNIDCSTLKRQSVVKVLWRCDSCNLEKLKPYRDCLANSGLCQKCNGIKNATMMSKKFGKAQTLKGNCIYCQTPIRSQHVTCKKHHKEHLTKIRSGPNNPAWKGTNICICGHKKSTGAKQCRQCSFSNGDRSGSNNGRWEADRGKIISAKIARTLLSNTLRATSSKKNGTTASLLKYKFQDLKVQIETQFEPWMNWTNRGIKKGQWSIDHIIPVTILIKHGVTDPAIINALWNLRPFDTIKNIKKGNSLDEFAINLAYEKLNLKL